MYIGKLKSEFSGDMEKLTTFVNNCSFIDLFLIQEITCHCSEDFLTEILKFVIIAKGTRRTYV